MNNHSFEHRIYWRILAVAVLVASLPFLAVLNQYHTWAAWILAGLIAWEALFFVPMIETYGNAQFVGFWYALRLYFESFLIGNKAIREQTLLSLSGVPVGRFRYLPFSARYSGGFHLITIAPNGSGKHTDVQAPTLFTYDESIFCLDPKGENTAVCAAWRRDGFGQKVYIINPFDEHASHLKAQGFHSWARFNPLEQLDCTEKNFTKEIEAIAESLIENTGGDAFFDLAAKNLIIVFLMFVCVDPGESASLPRVRALIMQGTKGLTRTLESMETSQFLPLRQAVAAAKEKLESRTMESVLLTLQAQTAWLNNPAISESLSASDFQWEDLKREKVTVFLIVPANMLQTFGRWFRLMLTSAINAHMKTPRKRKRPVLYMLDEFPALGNMPLIENSAAQIRGYGVQFHIFLQNIGQLKRHYKDGWNTFIANAGAVQFFTPNDDETAAYLSDKCGQYTIKAHNLSSTGAVSEREVTRPLIYPNEARGIYPDRQIIFLKGHRYPYLVRKVPYYETRLKKRAKKNPFIV